MGLIGMNITPTPTLWATSSARVVPADPVTSLLVMYGNYIMFGIGMFLILYYGRRLLHDWIDSRRPNEDGGDNGHEQPPKD